MKNKLIQRLEIMLRQKNRIVLAIDGMAAAGKSTLAEQLKDRFSGEIIHMDHFFLPKTLRTEERLAQPGGNVHYERFCREVITPLFEGMPLSYGIFDCAVMEVTKYKTIVNNGLVIIEGAYSLRPEFRQVCDIKVFMEITAEEQMKRIERRNGPVQAEVFKSLWIPMENRYFEEFKIKEQADIVI